MKSACPVGWSKSGSAFLWITPLSHQTHECLPKTVCVPFIEMNVQSYRQRSAATRQKQRPPSDSKRDTKQKEIITASST